MRLPLVALSVAVAAASIRPCPARAADAATCGTVVVPAGVGISDPAPIATLFPPLYTGGLYEEQTMALLFRPLIWANDAHRIDHDMSLAQSIDVLDGGATFRITLKPWNWSDGTRVTADDVVYTWEIIHGLGAAYALYNTGGIPNLVRDVTATGDDVVTFHLTQKVNPDWFELAGIGQFYPVPRHVYGRMSLEALQTRQSETSFYPVTDGPFRLAELKLGQYAVFDANPAYSGHRAQIRRLVVNFLQGTDPLAALEGGQVDIANLPFQVFDDASRLGDFRKVPVGPSALFYTIIPNIRSADAPFLGDAAVRRAISMAVDQQRLMRVVFHGNSLLQRGYVPTALGDFLPPDLRSGHTPLDFDPARAGKVLDDLGYRMGPDGVRAGHGQRLAFDVLVTAGLEERLLILELVQNDLAKIGISMSIKQLEFNQIIARMLGPPTAWEATFIGWSMPAYPDGSQWFSSTSSSNYSHYSDKRMDALLDAATADPGDAGLFALEHYAIDQQPMIFLPGGFYTVLARPGIGGIHKFIQTNAAWAPEFLTLEGPMACHDPHAHATP